MIIADISPGKQGCTDTVKGIRSLWTSTGSAEIGGENCEYNRIHRWGSVRNPADIGHYNDYAVQKENVMLYIEYTQIKIKYRQAERSLERILTEKDKLFQRTQPKSTMGEYEREFDKHITVSSRSRSM